MFILYNCCLGLEASATDIDLSTTLVPQSNQNKYQDSVGISTLVPQSHISMQLESVNMENSVRQTRTRIATQIYTPSKTLRVIQNYRLNVRKAAEKLIDATSRRYL
jgi:hypothetical protein